MTSENNKSRDNPGSMNSAHEQSSRSVKEDFEKLVSLFKKNGMVYAPKINGSTHRDSPTNKR